MGVQLVADQSLRELALRSPSAPRLHSAPVSGSRGGDRHGGGQGPVLAQRRLVGYPERYLQHLHGGAEGGREGGSSRGREADNDSDSEGSAQCSGRDIDGNIVGSRKEGRSGREMREIGK